MKIGPVTASNRFFQVPDCNGTENGRRVTPYGPSSVMTTEFIEPVQTRAMDNLVRTHSSPRSIGTERSDFPYFRIEAWIVTKDDIRLREVAGMSHIEVQPCSA